MSARNMSAKNPTPRFANSTTAEGPWIQLACLGVVSALLVFLPQFVDDYVLAGFILAAIFLFPCLGLNIIFGYTGMLSFAQGAFFGIGGYVSAILSTRLGLPFWAGLPAAILVTGIIAALLAVPALRLSRFSFVMVTIGMLLITQTIAGHWSSVTQGHMGITNIPKPSVTMGDVSFKFQSVSEYYYLALSLSILGIAAALAVVSSPLGRCFRAVRDDDLLASAYGMPIKLIKTISFALSGAFAAVGGVLQVHYISLASPFIFDFYYTNAFLIIVIVGGRGSFWSIPIATVLFVVISQLLSISPQQQLVAMGFLLVISVFWLPNGLGPLIAEGGKKLRARASA